MNDIVADKLLASIESDRLVILCGAGLSMASPSLVPSAKELSWSCANKYSHITGSPIPDDVKEDLEKFAEFLQDRGQLISVLINRLVDWGLFRYGHNIGHSAVSDFLACGAIDFAVTTNFDTLIENAAKSLGENDFVAALNGSEANVNRVHKTLLKIHGCCARDRDNTVWCLSKLKDEPITSNLATSKKYLMGHLQNRDVLILGFWTDWRFLISVLEDSLSSSAPKSVMLVSPDPAETWEKRHRHFGLGHIKPVLIFHMFKKGLTTSLMN